MRCRRSGPTGYRKTLAELRELPTRALRDLDFNRGELAAFAHRAVYGPDEGRDGATIAPSSSGPTERNLTMAHAINLNAYVDRAGGLFTRLRQSFADYRACLAIHEQLDSVSRLKLAMLCCRRL